MNIRWFSKANRDVCSLSCQMTESYESAWYGTFKRSPDEPYPTPDSDLYSPSIYVSILYANIYRDTGVHKLISNPYRTRTTQTGENSLARS